MKNIHTFLLRPRIAIPTLLLGALVFGYLVFSIGKGAPTETIALKRGTITQEVTVTGKTKAASSVNLAFEHGGKVAQARVGVGDHVLAGQILLVLDQNELTAQLAQAKATLESEAAKLAELKQGTRSEEINIQEAKTAGAKAALNDARQNVEDKLEDAYTKADDAVRNKTDQFFSSGRSANPRLSVAVTNADIAPRCEQERSGIELELVRWRSSLDATSSDTLDTLLDATKKNLTHVKSFLETISLALNAALPNSSFSQTAIDGFRSDISTARTNVNTAITNLSAAEEKFTSAQANFQIAERELILKRVGASTESIAAKEADVRAAHAKVELTSAQLEKTILRAPLTGIVTKRDIELGEIASANTPILSIISAGKLEIEAHMAEIDIGHVGVGNPVRISVDALPGESFSGKVIYIEPAETIVDGIVNFKVRIAFDGIDQRLKSGLTANLVIETVKKSGVLVLPQYALSESDRGTYVRVPDGKTGREVEVKTGLRSQSGDVEIISGLKEGDLVFINASSKEK